MIKKLIHELIDLILTFMTLIYQLTILMIAIEYLSQRGATKNFLIFIALCAGAFLYWITKQSDSQK